MIDTTNSRTASCSVCRDTHAHRIRIAVPGATVEIRLFNVVGNQGQTGFRTGPTPFPRGLHATLAPRVSRGMKRNRPRQPNKGFTLIEILIVMAIILVIAAIAIPNFGRQLMAAHESAVIQQIGTLHQAEAQYYSQFGDYAGSLTQLGPPTSGTAGPAAADIIPEGLADGHASGYVWTLTASPTGYAISAVPERFGNTGSRTFYSDQTRVIRHSYSQEPATASSPALGISTTTPVSPSRRSP
jgi:type IV pilus assembly protein PilA